ncbi:hypothetical protein N9Y89_02355, partial [bacterium]|nr:hypothetical protein [bacterium]
NIGGQYNFTHSTFANYYSYGSKVLQAYAYRFQNKLSHSKYKNNECSMPPPCRLEQRDCSLGHTAAKVYQIALEDVSREVGFIVIVSLGFNSVSMVYEVK